MSPTSVFGPRTDVRDHLARSRAALLAMLADLSASDWTRPTVAGRWTVRDVAAHLLGDDVNRLSRSRDDHTGEGPRPGETLPAFVHRINDEWVRATARVGPAVVVDLLAATTPLVLAHWASVDLDALGEPVTWAGPDPAPVWLDCARDFTEYWIHARQIRDATGRPLADPPSEVHAVLDTLLRAVPHTLAEEQRPDGTTVQVRVDGPGGGRWTWVSDGGAWLPAGEAPDGTVVHVGDAGTVWRLCSRIITPDEAGRRVRVVGDAALANRLLQIVSVIR